MDRQAQKISMNQTIFWTRLVILTSLTLAMEMIGLPQPVTGPIVNLMLILTTLILNPIAAVILGTITPTVAVIRGQLPAILMPMVPFIILGNALLVLTFGFVRHLLSGSRPPASLPLKSPANWAGLLAGSFAKFLWLYFSVKHILPLLIGKTLPPRLVSMMALPQLITALIGGALALAIYQILRKSFGSFR